MYPIAELSKASAIFGCNALEIMPKYEDIPKEFKNLNRPTKWNRLVTDWFFRGLKQLDIVPKEGVDKSKALTHIKCIIGSFEPQDEHKEAAAAYLLSEWFDSVEWVAAEMKNI